MVAPYTTNDFIAARTAGTGDIIPVNNPLERILREIRRRTRVVGAFPDGQSALNLAAARLRYIAGTAWSTKRYLNIELLKDQQMRGAVLA
jgi:transposase-like protein